MLKPNLRERWSFLNQGYGADIGVGEEEERG